MAKAQGISLNPQEITGMCGRLRCCLVFEYEQYVEAKKTLPKKGKRVGTPHGEGRVRDVRPMRESVLVDVDGKYHEVFKHELEPLAELEALKKKAEAGCSKHEGGGCDCGAKSGKAEVAQAAAAKATPPPPEPAAGEEYLQLPGEPVDFGAVDELPTPDKGSDKGRDQRGRPGSEGNERGRRGQGRGRRSRGGRRGGRSRRGRGRSGGQGGGKSGGQRGGTKDKS